MSDRIAIGSSFKTQDIGHPIKSSDGWFRPVDIKAGPDGAVYVCDWYDAQVNHYRNHEGKSIRRMAEYTGCGPRARFT